MSQYGAEAGKVQELQQKLTDTQSTKLKL